MAISVIGMRTVPARHAGGRPDWVSGSVAGVAHPLRRDLVDVCMLGAGAVLKFACKVHAHAVEHDRAAASIVAERARAAKIAPHARAQYHATFRRRSGGGDARVLGRRRHRVFSREQTGGAGYTP